MAEAPQCVAYDVRTFFFTHQPFEIKAKEAS